MNIKEDKYNIKLVSIIGSLIILELLASTLLLHDSLTHAVIDAAFILVILLLVVLFLKMKDKGSTDYLKDRQRLDHIFDTLDVAIWSHDLKTNTLLITPGIENLYGYSLETFYEN